QLADDGKRFEVGERAALRARGGVGCRAQHVAGTRKPGPAAASMSGRPAKAQPVAERITRASQSNRGSRLTGCQPTRGSFHRPNQRESFTSVLRQAGGFQQGAQTFLFLITSEVQLAENAERIDETLRVALCALQVDRTVHEPTRMPVLMKVRGGNRLRGEGSRQPEAVGFCPRPGGGLRAQSRGAPVLPQLG